MKTRGLGREEMPLNAHKALPSASVSPSPSIFFCPADRLFVAVFYFSPSKLKKDSARLTAIPKKYFFFFFFLVLFRIRSCEK